MPFEEVLKYLEAAAYIAIVLAVIGVPQMLSSYFDIRDRRQARAEAERIRREELAEQKADAERRHVEMMTALFAIIDRTGNGRRDGSDQGDEANAEILRRLAAIEAALGIASEPNGDYGDRNGEGA